MTAKEILKLRDICLRFGKAEVLRGVDLEVAQGEVVVIIGGSGSGKTSLLRCINLLNTPSSGSIVIDGETLLGVLLQEHVSTFVYPPSSSSNVLASCRSAVSKPSVNQP